MKLVEVRSEVEGSLNDWKQFPVQYVLSYPHPLLRLSSLHDHLRHQHPLQVSSCVCVLDHVLGLVPVPDLVLDLVPDLVPDQLLTLYCFQSKTISA